MKTITQHPVYGSITYEESFWIGKKQVSINGVLLQKRDKKSFIYNDGETTKTVVVMGGFVGGVKLSISGEVIPVVPAPKWYEILCSIVIVMLILVWGNSVVLCSILPIVGGALGGAVSGAMAVLNLVAMRSMKEWWQKLLLWVGMLFGTVLICYVLALVIIGALIA